MYLKYAIFFVEKMREASPIFFNKKYLGIYTPRIYAAGYIVFALTFVRSYVRSFVRSCVRSFVTFRHVRRIYIKVFG